MQSIIESRDGLDELEKRGREIGGGEAERRRRRGEKARQLNAVSDSSQPGGEAYVPHTC